MRRRGDRRALVQKTPLRTVLVGLLWLTLPSGTAAAQSPQVRQLDKEAELARSEYVQRMEQLAAAYEQAGETDKAKSVLRHLLELDPQRKEARDTLSRLENLIFETRTTTVEVDATGGWVPTGLLVERDRPVRFVAEGSYKFIANVTLGPDGVPTADLARDVAAGIDFGKLIGLVVTPPGSTAGDRDQAARPGVPFAIGSKAEVRPEADGLLLLRLNIPGGTKSNGRIKVTISGHIRRAAAP